MSRGLIRKSLHEVWAVTLLCGLGVLAFEILLAHVMRSFQAQIADHWFQVEFIRNIIKALLGVQITEGFDLGAMSSIAWVHPVILALLWAHEITLCTRVPAGEVDRGTADVLFSLPVSRWRVYLCETLVWLVGGIVVIGMGLIGSRIGNLPAEGGTPPSLARTLVIVTNLYCLYLAVGGLAFLMSALSDRRGRAVAATFTIVLMSFLLSFLVQFWEPAQHLSFLSMLNYYRPLLILRDTAWPIADMITLTGCAAALWLAGGLVFARRDICTV